MVFRYTFSSAVKFLVRLLPVDVGGEVEILSVNGNSVTVPDVVGMTAQNAIKTLQAKGLNVRIEGTSNYAEGEGATVISQKIEVGTSVKYGSVVSITCRYLTDADDAEIEE